MDGSSGRWRWPQLCCLVALKPSKTNGAVIVARRRGHPKLLHCSSSVPHSGLSDACSISQVFQDVTSKAVSVVIVPGRAAPRLNAAGLLQIRERNPKAWGKSVPRYLEEIVTSVALVRFFLLAFPALEVAFLVGIIAVYSAIESRKLILLEDMIRSRLSRVFF